MALLPFLATGHTLQKPVVIPGRLFYPRRAENGHARRANSQALAKLGVEQIEDRPGSIWGISICTHFPLLSIQ